MQDDGNSAAARQQRAQVVAMRQAHWLRTRRVTGVLLAMWFVTTFGTVYYARELATLSVFGWPLSFYLAAQGASLIYLAIIGIYAWWMRRIDLRAARLQRETA